MTRKLIRYRIHHHAEHATLQAIARLVEAVASKEPHVRYEVFREADGVSFTHVIVFPDAVAERTHFGSDHAMAFLDAIHEHCDHRPVFVDATLVAQSHGA